MNLYIWAAIIWCSILVGLIILFLMTKFKSQPHGTRSKRTTTHKTNIVPVQPEELLPNHPSQAILNRLGIDSETREQPRQSSTATKNSIETALTVTPPDETIVITQSAADSPEFLELKEKYLRLETIFKEKSSELEKKEASLANELRIRKDFNKVKDILEKELKEVKEKNHKTSVEMSSAKQEISNQKHRLEQLEERLERRNKDINERDNKINELTKQLTNLTGKLPLTEKNGNSPTSIEPSSPISVSSDSAEPSAPADSMDMHILPASSQDPAIPASLLQEPVILPANDLKQPAEAAQATPDQDNAKESSQTIGTQETITATKDTVDNQPLPQTEPSAPQKEPSANPS